MPTPCECKNENIIRDMDKRLHDGDLVLHDLKKDVQKGNEMLKDFHKRMFVDNGTPSVQTRLDRSDRIIKTIMWVVTAIAGSVIGMGIKIIMTAKIGA